MPRLCGSRMHKTRNPSIPQFNELLKDQTDINALINERIEYLKLDSITLGISEKMTNYTIGMLDEVSGVFHALFDVKNQEAGSALYNAYFAQCKKSILSNEHTHKKIKTHLIGILRKLYYKYKLLA